MRLLIAFIAFTMFGQMHPSPGPGRAAVGGAASYLIEEGAEGTGTPSGWTNTGSPNWDYTTTVLAGSQSLALTGAATPPRAHYDTGSAYSEFWVRFRFRTNTLTAATRILAFRTQSGDSERARVAYNNDPALHSLQCVHGTSTAQTTAALAVDTTYNIWVRYKAGTGSNGEMSCAFSETDTEPTSGNNFASTTTGSITSSIDRFQVRAETSNTGTTHIFDSIIVHNAAIGNL